MSIAFKNDLNLDQNELLAAVVHKSTAGTRPATPALGQISYDTDLLTIVTWNGSAWVSVSDTDAVLNITPTAPITATEDGSRNFTIGINAATTGTLGSIQLASDLGGTGALPTVESVGGKTAAEITTTVNASHDQNTDTGTTQTSFDIDSGGTGFKLKNVAGEVQARNLGDTAFADLRVKNLTVTGTTTQIDSNTVNIGDNKIELNSDITAAASNSDGGVAVKRLQAGDTLRADAELNFNNTSGRWDAVHGDTSDLQTHAVALKHVTSIGDNAAKDYVITHNLNTRDVTVAIRENASPYALVLTDVEMTSVDTLTVKFKKIVTAGQYTVTVVG